VWHVGRSWLTTAGCRGLSQTYAVEAQAFVLHCTAVISDKAIDEVFKNRGTPVMGSPNTGSSAVIAPDGRILTSPGQNEQLVFADLDMSLVTKAKTFADASGHCE
jgi:nitrilase